MKIERIKNDVVLEAETQAENIQLGIIFHQEEDNPKIRWYRKDMHSHPVVTIYTNPDT